MSITKLLALILSFQASVQAVSLIELYKQSRKNNDEAALNDIKKNLKNYTTVKFPQKQVL
jgi:hypothetical protein